MEFGILGPLEVRREGRIVAVGGPKPRALLAVLLLSANEPVSAERLAVAADIMGKSGRDMLDALVAGETDPDVLAELARGRCARRSPRCARRSPDTSTRITGYG
jgi:hypothetical protein